MCFIELKSGTWLLQTVHILAIKLTMYVFCRLHQGSKKVKFVVNGPLPSDCSFPSFRDFEVVHHYLQTTSRMMQSRLRKRGRKGKWSYTHTIRKQVCKDNSVDILVGKTTTRVLYL